MMDGYEVLYMDDEETFKDKGTGGGSCQGHGTGQAVSEGWGQGIHPEVSGGQ